MSAATRIVVDYTSAIEPGALGGVAVIAPDGAKRRFGDPAPRSAYTAAFREALARGPAPVLGLVGPYGYSPAYTAAAGGRSDLAREEIDPDRVRVLNVGRSFLGLGALTASLAAAALVPEEATRWLDNASVATGMWLVAESERLRAATAEAFVEAPEGIPEAPYALIRVRLAARVLGGCATPAEGAQAALTAFEGGRGVGLVANAHDGLAAWGRSAPADVEWRACVLPAFLASHFGDALAFAIAPRAGA